MDKEFVPYQESLELKELGFNDDCICAYNLYGQLKGVIIGSIDGDYIKKDKWDERLAAPLFQQSFRWFREKYGLRIRNYGSVNHSGELSECFEIFKYGYGTSDKSLSIEVEALTYEASELACLRKLIEITKTVTDNK